MATSDTLRFFGGFLRHPASIGAVAPSSPALAREMVRDLTLGREQTLIEFGPGTGPFTRAIAGIMQPGAAYLGIELQECFVTLLRERYPRMDFVQASAAQAAELHRARHLPPVRAILCGLPFASLPPTVQDAVIANLDTLLGAGSEFRTFQYAHACPLPTAVRFRRRMSQLFGPCRCSRLVFHNMPPAYVLRWAR